MGIGIVVPAEQIMRALKPAMEAVAELRRASDDSTPTQDLAAD